MALAWLFNLGFGARQEAIAIISTYGPPVPTSAFTFPTPVFAATKSLPLNSSTFAVGMSATIEKESTMNSSTTAALLLADTKKG